MIKRNAFTLVELLTTMTMGSSLMLLAVGLVHQSMSMSKLAKIRGEHDQSLARLAQQFRSDVHTASELISISSESLTLRLTDESMVIYKRESANVTWAKTGLSSEVAHETFRFDERCLATFTKQSNPNRVVLQIERPVESTEFSPPVDLRVIAVVGRWHQLEQAGDKLP